MAIKLRSSSPSPLARGPGRSASAFCRSTNVLDAAFVHCTRGSIDPGRPAARRLNGTPFCGMRRGRIRSARSCGSVRRCRWSAGSWPARMIDIFDREVELVFVSLRVAAILTAAVRYRKGRFGADRERSSGPHRRALCDREDDPWQKRRHPDRSAPRLEPWDLRRVRCRLRQTKIGLLTKACEPCAATHQLVSPAVRSGQLARHTSAPLLQSGVAAAEPPLRARRHYPRLRSICPHPGRSRVCTALRAPRGRGPHRRDPMLHNHRGMG